MTIKEIQPTYSLADEVDIFLEASEMIAYPAINRRYRLLFLGERMALDAENKPKLVYDPIKKA